MHVDRLLREHAKLRSLSEELLKLVSSPTPCDFQTLTNKRWELSRTIHQHLAYEDRQLFQRLLADPRPEVQAAGLRGRRAIENVYGLYKAHVEQWTAAEILKRWPQFHVAIKTMVMRMTLRLDEEERTLFPLIESGADVALGWQPGTRNWAGDGVAMQPVLAATAGAAKQPVGAHDAATDRSRPR